MVNVRWKTILDERVKRSKDCIGTVRWKAPSVVAERVKRKINYSDVVWRVTLLFN
jgi:hypothetical protein